MPRAFDITPASPTIKTNADGKAEVSFTVSNKLGRQVRARARPEIEGSTQSKWLSIIGSDERDFASDGTQQVTVRFAADPGTVPGPYPFHLLVSNVSNPDDEYAHGPTVIAQLEKVKVEQRKPFPWWILIL